jgi:sarcosine oxidase
MNGRRSPFSCLVIGGGVAGLATAWHLARMGEARVGLVERFRVGHSKGSSHGAGRITRSSYADELYVRLMRTVQDEEWPRLERDAGTRLVHRCDGVFFGPAGGPFDDHVAAVAGAGAGAGVELLEVAAARRRFPLFRFPDAAGVLHDRTAGVVAAAETVRALARLALGLGVAALEEMQVLGLDASGDPIVVDTDRGQLFAEHVVITAGAWVPRLVPALASRLTVRRQSVGYFRMDAPAAALGIGAFPVWIHTGVDAAHASYGLPEFGTTGIKAARHETAGASQDPDDPSEADAGTLRGVRDFLAEQLAVPVLELLHHETCLYTSTDDEDFVIGPLPGDPRIVVGSACSGHGFKFGPLTGRLLAELVIRGRTSVPEFEASRERFAV